MSGPPSLVDDEEVMREGYEGNCPHCHRGDLITVTMTVAERELAFVACHACEAKWWKRDGEDVPLGSVLSLVTTLNTHH